MMPPRLRFYGCQLGNLPGAGVADGDDNGSVCGGCLGLELELRRELIEIVISNGVGDVEAMRDQLVARMTDQVANVASTA